ncbi:S-adenosylmethionine decarboxylase family protein [Filimonas effusa]|uniref:S-adenosylmethionine decarboxylase family protein n=1 Tax=Filimonas effusa TaxID=2508721 RepID=UPI0013E975FC|nr:S-adenosylmethionine decarboxylase [Filimonas effusa]
MKYLPGTHIIASLETADIALLTTHEAFQQEINRLIASYDLHNLGAVYHNFSPAGFTAVICLSESHISIHTWPEFGKVNLDIYLSNYKRCNDGTVQAIYEALVTFFKARVLQHHNLNR